MISQNFVNNIDKETVIVLFTYSLINFILNKHNWILISLPGRVRKVSNYFNLIVC